MFRRIAALLVGWTAKKTHSPLSHRVVLQMLLFSYRQSLANAAFTPSQMNGKGRTDSRVEDLRAFTLIWQVMKVVWQQSWLYEDLKHCALTKLHCIHLEVQLHWMMNFGWSEASMFAWFSGTSVLLSTY